MLRFNTFRSKRYLRSKFVEGKFLLASEATDLELELLDLLRKETAAQFGDVAIEDAWKVEKLSATQILIKPGDAYFKGLPYAFRAGKDQLVSGAVLTVGTVPVGVTTSDDANGLGKIITFNNAAVTPSNLYRVVITAKEELLTEVDDPFLQNSNLTESTSQKIRLIYQINIVPDSLQTETPIPFTDETSASASVTNFPNSGGMASPNFVNQTTITPTAAGNGELVALNLITGSEGIDGRDVELTIRNDGSIGGGIVLPNSPASQQAFANGKLIDSVGTIYHINAIFNDTVSTQLVIRIDKEPDQPNPQIINTKAFTLQKRDVFVTDDSNGSPQGKLHWAIATVDFDTTDGIVHESKVVDLRNKISTVLANQKSLNKRVNVVPLNSGNISWNSTTHTLVTAAQTKLFNGIQTADLVSATSYVLKNDSCLAFTLSYDGSTLNKGNQSITISSVAVNDATLAAVSLVGVELGNLVKDSAGNMFYITAIDDVNNIITLNAAPATGAATIYKDSYQEGYVKDDNSTYILAVRYNDKVYIADLELESGETSQIGDGVSQQLLAYIGATAETDSMPAYSSNNYVTDGTSLTTAIGDLDAAINVVAGTVRWKSPVANFAALPALGNLDGDVRLILDTRIAYHYETATTSWKPLTGTGSVKVIGGGTVSNVVAGSDRQLTFTSNMFLEVSGLSYADNTISTASSPITFTSSLQVAYVIPNTATGGPTLTVIVGALSSVPKNAVIIARRETNDIIVGSSSTRLKDSQSADLYAQASNQNLTYIGAASTASSQPSYTSNIRGTANESLTARAGQLTDAIGDAQEDRSAYFRSNDSITWTGSQLQFTTDIVLDILNRKAGGTKTATILVANSPISLTDGQMAYITIDRTLASENLVPTIASSLPAQTQANKDIIILAYRKDVSGTGYLHIPLHKQVIEAGQTVRLGASGSGSGTGSGVGDDLTSLQYRASFNDNFSEAPSDAKSSVDTSAGLTDAAAYSAAKGLYQLSYDASKTVAAGTTTTNLNISASAAFTVKIGDVAVYGSEVKKITAVSTQASFTTEAFSVAPTLAGQITISQAVHTKDIYNFAADGSALSAAFGATAFSDVLVDYEDTTTVGDSIYDVNVAPVIGFSASHNGTSYTALQIRPTLETDTISSTTLNSSGTALYLRFFAYKQSGSGSVNILRYKSWMQKSVAASAGGVTNSAYAFTNGVGTPVNCTVGLLGGKTALTLTWQYAVGMYSGTSASSVEVWINGQKVPRFINATLTPDGSFTEENSNVIKLDKDYSGVNISVEVFQRTQIVDASTENTTFINSLQQIQQKGFQPFVDTTPQIVATTTTGSPAQGTFYSSITNRASIMDLTQDLRVRVGIDRRMIQQISQLQNEFGPNGEAVYSAVNDTFGQIRFVGPWANSISTNGSTALYTGGASTTDPYVEVTFYGTGLNLLSVFAGAGYNIVYSVDGGADSANITAGTYSTILGGRNYTANQVLPVVSGLALGIHTVKIKPAAAGSQHIQGFEILTEATTLKVNSGSSYSNGKKLTLAAQQSPAYNSTFESGTLGARGGRVLVYQKSDGTIAKAVTPTNTTALTSTSADHTNEDVARVYHWREFGAARGGDDFSTFQVTTPSPLAFALDDATTALQANDVSLTTTASPLELRTNGAFVAIHFVGTGLDFIQQDHLAGGADTYNFSVDGGSTVALNTAGNTTKRTTKLVSGLPYGSHVVRITRVTAATFNVGIHGFIVYQPKKPTLPAGATELSDYNILATYVANNNPGTIDSIATGVMRKFNQREQLFIGTHTATFNSTSATTVVGGWIIGSQTNADTIRYTFFGTGFELRQVSGSSLTFTISVDGSTNLSGFTTSSYGTNLTFAPNPATVTQAGAGQNGQGVIVNGLALGLHTVILTKTGGAGTTMSTTFDVITPVHSYKSNVEYDQQNTLPVGSQAVGDIRKITPIKETYLQKKNVSQAFGITANPTTTSTTMVPLNEASVVHYNNTGRIKITYIVRSGNSGATNTNSFNATINGNFIFPNDRTFQAFANNAVGMVTDSIILNVSPGHHKIDVTWAVNAGTATAIGNARTLIVEEV